MLKIIKFLITNYAFGGIKLNINSTHKYGMDKGLILVSEYHFVVILENDEPFEIDLKNGLYLHLRPRFFKNVSKFYGPNGVIEIIGYLESIKGNLILEFPKVSRFIPIGVERKFSFNRSKGQLLEILIKPEIK